MRPVAISGSLLTLFCEYFYTASHRPGLATRRRSHPQETRLGVLDVNHPSCRNVQRHCMSRTPSKLLQSSHAAKFLCRVQARAMTSYFYIQNTKYALASQSINSRPATSASHFFMASPQRLALPLTCMPAPQQ
eukprot:6189161-Pleurochrysis_carterae.AAC.5